MTDHPSALVSVPVEAVNTLKRHIPSLDAAATPTKSEVFVVCGHEAREMHDAIAMLAAAPAAPQADGVGDYTMALAEPQAFETFPALAAHIERMAVGHGVGSLIEWDAFLRDLNAALRTPSREPEGGAASRIAELEFELRAKTYTVEICEEQIERLNARIAALATREEAPAEAGEDEAFCEGYYDAHLNEAWTALREGRPYQVNADGAISLIQQAASDRRALRAQPPAREDAKPVGLDESQRKAVERAAMDAGAYSWRNARLAMVEGDKIVGYPAFSRADMAELARLYTTPPSQPLAEGADAEKLRVAVEALEDIAGDDKPELGPRNTNDLLARMYWNVATKALAALRAEQGAK